MGRPSYRAYRSGVHLRRRAAVAARGGEVDVTQFERMNINEQIADRDVYIPGLDKGIERAVFILRNHGIETLQSCEGGPGHPENYDGQHAYPVPTVDFGGGISEGYRAYAVALANQRLMPGLVGRRR